MVLNHLTRVKIADILNEISDLLLIIKRSKSRPISYKKIAESIISYNLDLNQLKSIDPSIFNDINEIINTGTCSRLRKLRRKINHLSLDVQEIKNLPINVRKYLAHRTINDGKISRKILIQYEDALKLAHNISNQLMKCGVDKTEVCGSLRRRANYINDLDFVILDTSASVKDKICGLLDKPIEVGPSKISGLISDVHVDFRFAKENNWGAMLIHCTGNRLLNVKLREKALRMGMKLNEYGLWKNGVIIASRTEQEIFNALGLKFIEPADRSL